MESGKHQNEREQLRVNIPLNCHKKIRNRIFLILLLGIIFGMTYLSSIYTQKSITLTYKEESNLDYRIYLKKNNYYQASSLGRNMHYIASLIDYIDVTFNYNFLISNNIDYNCNYYIEADITVFEKSNPKSVIFEKKEKLVESVSAVENNSNNVQIRETAKVDYERYNNLIREFKTIYNISADSNLTLNLYIEIDGDYEKFEYPIKINNIVTMKIPLTEQVISIDAKDIRESEELTGNEIQELSTVLRYASLLFAILTVIYILRFIVFIIKIRSKKSLYQRQLEKILKNYERVVIEIKEMIKIQNETDIVDVVNFDELLAVSDRLERPILFIETEPNRKSWFAVKDKEEVYRYILEE